MTIKIVQMSMDRGANRHFLMLHFLEAAFGYKTSEAEIMQVASHCGSLHRSQRKFGDLHQPLQNLVSQCRILPLSLTIEIFS